MTIGETRVLSRMANLLKTEDEQYKTGATYDGDEGELVVTPKRVLFESNDRNTKIHVGLKDVVGVEMMREPVDWGATLVGIPLLLAAYASFIATQLMPPELTGVLFAVGGVCGLGGLGLVIYAVLRSRVLTIRTAGRATSSTTRTLVTRTRSRTRCNTTPKDRRVG